MTIVNGDSPWTEAEPLTVSIKVTPEYDSALLVFKGTPASIRQHLIEFFGLDEVSPTDTVYDVFTEAEAKARAQGNPSAKNGDRRSWSKAPKATSTPAPATAPASDLAGLAAREAQPEPTHDEAVDNAKAELNAEVVEDKVETPQHKHADILAAIEATTNKRDLIKLTTVAEYKPFMLKGSAQQDPDVAAAFKAKAASF